MKIVYNNFIPFKGYKIINLFGILFVRNDSKNEISDIDINHEKIHTEQMKELLYVGFYLWYILEYLICFIISRFSHKYSYHDISFEEEAYNNEKCLDYLNNRKHFSWIKYIKVKSYTK